MLPVVVEVFVVQVILTMMVCQMDNRIWKKYLLILYKYPKNVKCFSDNFPSPSPSTDLLYLSKFEEVTR